MVGDALHPRAGHRVVAGVDEGDVPVLALRRVVADVAAAQVHAHVRRQVAVLEEVLLDHRAAVAQAADEVVQAGGGVDLHDVPQQRPAADLDHRLGPVLGLFTHSRALATAQDHDFGARGGSHRGSPHRRRGREPLDG